MRPPGSRRAVTLIVQRLSSHRGPRRLGRQSADRRADGTPTPTGPASPRALQSKQVRLPAVNAKHPTEPALAPPPPAEAASAWDPYAAGFVARYFDAHP